MDGAKVMHESVNFSSLKAFCFALVLSSLAASPRAETPLGAQMDVMKGAFRDIKSAMEAPVDADRDAAHAQTRLINRAQGEGHEKFRSEES